MRSVLVSVASVFLATLPLLAEARIPRDRAEVRAFRQVSACPSTGLYRGRCDGWEVDHIKSLCSGGPDRRENMQWIPKHDHKLKSFLDAKECREARRPISDR